MKHILESITHKNTRFLADGAWGTELFKRGVPSGDAPERFNMTEPGIVKAVASDYVTAGADIILTNSFGGTRLQLERHDLDSDVTEINRTAAELSVLAARNASSDGRSISVAGSIGPTGKLILTGDVTKEALYEVFLEQALGLVAGGVDFLLIESMTDLEEAVAGVKAAKDARGSGDVPIIASMVYEPVKTGGYRTIMGNTPEECVNSLLEAGAAIIGANCGTGIENYLGLAEELCTLDLAPVWIKPNRGIPGLENGKTVYKQTAKEFAGHAKTLLESGVSIVGGCCGTSPDFIRALRPVVDEFNKA